MVITDVINADVNGNLLKTSGSGVQAIYEYDFYNRLVSYSRGLLRTDKKFSALKERHKMKMAEWMYEAYRK